MMKWISASKLGLGSTIAAQDNCIQHVVHGSSPSDGKRGDALSLRALARRRQACRGSPHGLQILGPTVLGCSSGATHVSEALAQNLAEVAWCPA